IDFFSSGRRENDMIFTFDDSAARISASKHLISLFSSNFRCLNYYGKIGWKPYHISGYSEETFYDWLCMCYDIMNSNIRSADLDQILGLLHLAKHLESDQIFFDQFEQLLCACCGLCSEMARDIIICNLHGFKKLKFRSKIFFAMIEGLMLWNQVRCS
ncbi:hypothetical protein PFISCL1PPCAC_18188, partial [Pristionchus fissidentatus]